MEKKTRKKFVFATISVICGSVVTIMLNYPPEAYVKIIGIIVTVFTLAQTAQDIKKTQG